MKRETVLDAETILQATEEVLQRYGPAKASVVDVARVLGVSHGTVYRHFPSKAALREAVIRRWVERTNVGLYDAADDVSLPAPERLRHWLRNMFHTKRSSVLEDPELFDTYCQLVREQSGVIDDHLADLTAKIRVIVADGVETSAFAVQDIDATARAIFDATARFHHPAYVREWRSPQIDDDFEALCTLILDGVRSR